MDMFVTKYITSKNLENAFREVLVRNSCVGSLDISFLLGYYLVKNVDGLQEELGIHNDDIIERERLLGFYETNAKYETLFQDISTNIGKLTLEEVQYFPFRKKTLLEKLRLKKYPERNLYIMLSSEHQKGTVCFCMTGEHEHIGIKPDFYKWWSDPLLHNVKILSKDVIFMTG